MSEYGFRCSNCNNIFKFTADFDGISKDDPGYGKLISKFHLTCPTCGKRDSYPINDKIILGGPDAKVQTPKVIIEGAIEDLYTYIGFDISKADWEYKLRQVIEKLEKAKEKLPEF